MTLILVDYNGGQFMETLSLSEAKIKLSSLVDKVSNRECNWMLYYSNCIASSGCLSSSNNRNYYTFNLFKS